MLVGVPILLLGLFEIQGTTFLGITAHGPIQADHAEVACSECHAESPGSLRQQAQAQVAFWLGRRQSDPDFGYARVDEDTCLSCHSRANERHPIYRFREPRFIDAKSRVNATNCLGCHNEHEERRANADTTFCSACHQNLALRRDPLDISHAQLTEQERWSSCMSCHDFHGNHKAPPPDRLADGLSDEAIQAYLAQGPDPYGSAKYFKAEAK